MKKLTFILLALLMLLTACGKNIPEETTAALPSTDFEEFGPSDLDIANSCVGGVIEDLTSQLGEPLKREYFASQRDPSFPEAQEGILYYPTFIVYTYKEGDTEWIEYVEENTQE